ncbi:hypothetical protein BKA64DRAFT_649613 [Cadophora sp. MPI-SDFR-AT-0126]|nr:hypothetical protein BKA64DRAFT_649613 [Leotiomycetes sp. MPI-SDFR-AT-0126]
MEPPKLHKHSPVIDILAALEYIQTNASDKNSTILNPNIIAFDDGKTRSTCPYDDFKLASTFAEWISVPLKEAKHRAGFFATRITTYVGMSKDDEMLHHAWGAVLCADPDKAGKILILWDPNGNLAEVLDADLRYGNLLGMQRNLIRFCKTKYKINEVRLGGGRNPNEECSQMTREWIGRLMKKDIEPIELRNIRGYRLVRP